MLLLKALHNRPHTCLAGVELVPDISDVAVEQEQVSTS